MKAVFYYLGWLLQLKAIFLVLPLIVAFIYSEPKTIFIVTIITSFAIGSLFRKFSERGPLVLLDGIKLTVLSFLFLTVIGMIPSLPAFDYDVTDAYFESVSGFTTTGLTVIEDLDAFPRSTLFWRSETQWIGGIGIIIVFLFILSQLRKPVKRKEMEQVVETDSSLYRAGGFSERIEGTMKETTKKMVMIYGFYSVVGVVLLLLVGLPLFEAVTMMFTSLSTAGFVVTNDPYNTTPQVIVLCLLMIIGAVSFVAHNKLFRGKVKEFFTTSENKTFFILLPLLFLIGLFAVRDWKIALFELVSSITTTGFTITEVALLPHLLIMLMVICMIIGGSTTSTAGGIKQFRFYTMMKSMSWLVKKYSKPATAVIPVKTKKRVLEKEEMLITYVFVGSYILVISVGTILLMLLGNSFLDSSFQLTSALGTVGLQTMNIAEAGFLVKFVLIIAMFLGRLEIFPFIVLVKKMFSRG